MKEYAVTQPYCSHEISFILLEEKYLLRPLNQFVAIPGLQSSNTMHILIKILTNTRKQYTQDHEDFSPLFPNFAGTTWPKKRNLNKLHSPSTFPPSMDVT